MAMTGTMPAVRIGPARDDRKVTARVTGALYLAFFVTGIFGSVVVREQLFASGDPDATLANLVEHESLARAGIMLELGIVAVQALTAVWFYRLFRTVDDFSAAALALFGIVNAVAILASAAFLASALEVARDQSLAAPGGAAATAQLMYMLSDQVWGVAALFFGLWLIPMGWLAIRSRWMPEPLGWTLIVGGIGYFVSAFVRYAFADSDTAAQVLTLPSIVGELWMMAYLLIFGVRGEAEARAPQRT